MLKLLLILISVFSMKDIDSQNDSYQYFKHIVFRETPFAPIMGRIPIDSSLINNENHFKIEFDSLGRIVKIKYCLGQVGISIDRVGFMDGTEDLAPFVKIEYKGNLEIRTYFDENGNQIVNGREVFKAIYEYNEHHDRIGLNYYDSKGNPQNDSWGIHNYIWKKIDERQVMEKRQNTEGDFVPIRPFYKFMNVIYSYDERGMLLSMENVNEKGQLNNEETGTAVDSPIYDQDFNLVSFKFSNSQKDLVIGSFYDAAGGEIEYDSKGNMTKYSTLDLEGNYRSGSKSWAFIECEFDSKGNLLSERYFDENGHPAARKDAIRIDYSFGSGPHDKFKLKTKLTTYY